jgi:hypothetical protein
MTSRLGSGISKSFFYSVWPVTVAEKWMLENWIGGNGWETETAATAGGRSRPGRNRDVLRYTPVSARGTQRRLVPTLAVLNFILKRSGFSGEELSTVPSGW